ncbi:single-stranded-DNA-specific exonuclease RecJ [Winogradskyella sp. PC-19]|uniref:single-stranded-DNA-specific exonuclease RecJ n=1 Tax=unclassified Winogradskyella TaxID=2615021 RepID=UPI000B3C8018|nr:MULTISPECIES: single-stranded-DNA-specific exonuclease RecJ [unclassified Winogradskyella]ARV09788.1 single-stranded-DNA-specific exonuclease RecJ [Winogradskyella sp. PC-19]RZN82732.1 MAG: single-stranded-DNA-specific exonuclease RecJ [Winogradskyella sp.]
MRWTIKPKPEATKVEALQKALQVDETVATLLLQRDIETYEAAKTFFRPSFKDLHDPYLMKDMDKAVARIETAIVECENIMVYGDYDVDGTTSVALMSSYLKTKTENIATYIPDRYDEGYGVSYKGIDFAEDNGFSLIIALDCGVKAIEKVAYAKEKGIDFIICDHHRPGDDLPNAVAVLDPKRNDCDYPFKELCGCGVGFKLISALAEKEGHTPEDLVQYLDLVATAIGADIVPIVGENRALAYFGLQVINSNPRPGMKAMIVEVKKEELTITDVVFIIAPRINAAGRMKHGNHAVTLLTETDFNLAAEYAVDIDQYNTDRRETDKRITEEALIKIEENNEHDRFTTVVFDKDWHKGVIGIVASRLIETYYRPTLVFTKSGGKLAASARSVNGFDVYNALEACSEYIEQFGGHKYAAGLTLLPENYVAFKSKFEEVVKETIDPKLLVPELKIDLEIDLSQIDDRLMRILKQFAPFGPGNMTPVFMTQGIRDTGWGKCVGEDKTHIRLTASQNHKDQIVCIGFGLGNKIDLIKDKQLFNVAYTVDENHWNGNVSLQLKLKDIKA